MRTSLIKVGWRPATSTVGRGRLVAARQRCAIYHCRDRNQAAARRYAWTVTCIDSHVPEPATPGADPHHLAGRVPGLLPPPANQQRAH